MSAISCKIPTGRKWPRGIANEDFRKFATRCYGLVASRTRLHCLLLYAPHEHSQRLCPRLLAPACARFLTVTDIKGNVGGTCDEGIPSHLGELDL